MTLTSRQKKLLRCALFIFTLLLYIFPIFLKNPSLFFLLQLVWIITIHLLQQKMKLFNLTSPLKTWIILAFFFFYIILMPFLLFLSFSIERLSTKKERVFRS
ncbi:MAG: hypothetical protein ACLVIE_10620 [Enterococcus faecalis]